MANADPRLDHKKKQKKNHEHTEKATTARRAGIQHTRSAARAGGRNGPSSGAARQWQRLARTSERGQTRSEPSRLGFECCFHRSAGCHPQNHATRLRAQPQKPTKHHESSATLAEQKKKKKRKEQSKKERKKEKEEKRKKIGSMVAGAPHARHHTGAADQFAADAAKVAGGNQGFQQPCQGCRKFRQAAHT